MPNTLAHLRTLKAIHESMFAPQFRALEEYGRDPEPAPTVQDVIEAATRALQWNADKEIELAFEVAQRRKASNPILLDEAVQALEFARSEQVRIRAELDALTVPVAAE